MTYPSDAFFDIETLLNVAQPNSILLLGNLDPSFLDNYLEQKSLLKQDCQITQIHSAEVAHLEQLNTRFDVAIAIDLFEHIDKQQGTVVLSKLRDILSAQYCVCLPISEQQQANTWHITDLFSFALKRVASYTPASQDNEAEQALKHYGLFKYNINDYKHTPDWLNADNWANPQMWGKYRW